MLEFVFNKANLKALIDSSPEDQDEVLVRLAFSMGTDSIFPATVIARCQKTGEVYATGTAEVMGCLVLPAVVNRHIAQVFIS